MHAVSARWRWLAATTIAPMICAATPRTAEQWIGPVLFGLAIAALETLALSGPRSLRLRWFALTAIGVWLAFPFGLMAGIATYYAVAFPLSLLGLTGDQVATPALVLAVGFGALAGGAVVGALQAAYIRARLRWIARSAVGGLFVLPASIVALYGPSTSAAGQPPVLVVAAVAMLGGAIYGGLTVGEIAASDPARTAISESPRS